MGKKLVSNEGMGIVEDVLGCKWTLRVIDGLRDGKTRPGELQRSIPGLSAKVLNERLKKLVRFELVKRKVFPEIPPRVEYSFTAKGLRFLKILKAIKNLAG